MSKYETNAGIELTKAECSLIDSLKRLATRWKKHGSELILYDASGSLVLLLEGDTKRNPHPNTNELGECNQDCIIEIIRGIPSGAGI